MPTLIERATPRGFRDRLDELCRTDPAVTVLSYLLPPDRLLEWAHSVGVVTDAELGACVPPIPPVELRGITAASAPEVFLWTGLVDLNQLLTIGERTLVNPAPPSMRILDFGCGCGRMTRYLSNVDGIDAYGVDVNPDLVSWCQQNLPGVRTLATPELPPMPLPDGLIDLAYSLSVFTHLPADRAQEWLADIARVLAPGALLVLTIHGYQALEIIRKSPVHHQMFDLDERATEELVARLDAEGFLFLPVRDEVLKAAKTSSAYGHTFIHERYVAEHWKDAGFEVLEFIPGGLRNWQDIVVLRRDRRAIAVTAPQRSP
jgi:SAM-dependent methyltransferase